MEVCNVRDQGEVGSAVLGVLANYGDEEARVEVVARASAGDLGALAAMGAITDLDEAAAGHLIEKFEDMVRTTIIDAAARTYGMALFDPARGLTLFNLWFPSIARWEAVLALLADPNVAAEHKRGACETIFALVDRLPADVRTRVGSLVDQLSATVAQGLRGGEDLGGLAIAVAVSTGILEGSEANRAAARLAGGTVQKRCDLADLLGRGWCEPMRPLLASLIADESIEVRVAAARAAGRLAASHPEDEVLVSLAEALSEDGGVIVPRALLSGMLRADSGLAERLQTLAGRLGLHLAASVRFVAKKVLSSTAGAESHP